MTQGSPVEWLEAWYASQCDGEWEHQFGITIETLDNPGWSVSISLTGTQLEELEFVPVDDRFRSERDWVHCWVSYAKFEGRGGGENLAEILSVFRTWVEAESG